MSKFRAGPAAFFGSLMVDGDWSAGYLGNDEYIPLLGTDFNVREYADTGRTPQSGLSGVIEGQFTATAGAGAIRIPAGPNAGNSYAMKIVPRAYEAYAFIIRGTTTPLYGVRAFSSTLDSNSVADLQLSPGAQNIIHTFSSVVVGDGSNYVIISFDPANATSEVFGGKIFIRKKTF